MMDSRRRNELFERSSREIHTHATPGRKLPSSQVDPKHEVRKSISQALSLVACFGSYRAIDGVTGRRGLVMGTISQLAVR